MADEPLPQEEEEEDGEDIYDTMPDQDDDDIEEGLNKYIYFLTILVAVLFFLCRAEPSFVR